MAAEIVREERVVGVTTADGVACNVINVRGASAPTKGPVLLVHGAGVRANIFRAPSGRTLVDALIDAGHDVWLENWRASIDVPHNAWTLDQAAVMDHPAAVRTVLASSAEPSSASRMPTATARMVSPSTMIVNSP